MASEVGKGFVSIEPDTKNFSTKLTAAVQGEAAGVAKAGEKAGAALGEGVGAGVANSKGLGAGVAAASKVVGTGMLAIGGSILAVGGILAKVGDEFDAAYDTIRTGTGATGDALAALEGSFKTVVQAVPASFGDASKAISELNVRLGLTGKPLESLAEQFLDLSRITKTDLGANIEAVTGVFNSFGVAAQDQGGKLDELFRISQQTGVSVTDLAKQMADGGVKAKEAGLSFEETGALLGLLNKQGLSGSDVFPALARAMATAAKEGKSAKDVFQETFAAIQNAPDDVAAAGIAIDVFGAKAGPQFAALIRQGKLGYEEFAQAIGKGDTIEQAARQTDDWKESLTILKNQVLVALEPAAKAAFEGIGNLVKTLTPAIHSLTPAFAGVLTAVASIPAPITLAVTAIGGIALIAPKVIGAVKGIADGLSAIKDAGSTGLAFFGGLGGAGPILLGLAAAAAAVGAAFLIFRGHTSEVKKEADSLRETLASTAAGFDLTKVAAAGGGEEFTKFSEALKKASLKDLSDQLKGNSGALAAFNELHLTIGDLSDAVSGKFNPAVERAGTIAANFAARQVATKENLDAAAASLGMTTDEMLKLGPAAQTAGKFLSDQGAVTAATTEQILKLAAAGDPLYASMAQAKGILNQLTGANLANAEAAIANAGATDSSTTSTENMGVAAQGSTTSLQAYEGTMSSVATASGGVVTESAAVGQSFADVGAAAGAAEKSISDLLDAQLSAADSALALENANAKAAITLGDVATDTAALAEAQTKYGKTSTEAGQAAQKLDQTNRDLQGSVLDVANAAVRNAEDMAKASGATLTATAKNDAMYSSLQSLKAQFPGLSGVVDGYINKLHLIPPSKKTDVNVTDNGTAAATQSRISSIHGQTITVNVSTGKGVIGSIEWHDPQGGFHRTPVNMTAMGGIFDQFQIRGIAEAGAEAVIPLTKPARALDLLKDSGLADLVLASAAVQTGGERATTGGTTIMIDKVYGTVDRAFAQQVAAGIYKLGREN